MIVARALIHADFSLRLSSLSFSHAVINYTPLSPFELGTGKVDRCVSQGDFFFQKLPPLHT